MRLLLNPYVLLVIVVLLLSLPAVVATGKIFSLRVSTRFRRHPVSVLDAPLLPVSGQFKVNARTYLTCVPLMTTPVAKLTQRYRQPEFRRRKI
jgi:hypothetical protein